MRKTNIEGVFLVVFALPSTIPHLQMAPRASHVSVQGVVLRQYPGIFFRHLAWASAHQDSIFATVHLNYMTAAPGILLFMKFYPNSTFVVAGRCRPKFYECTCSRLCTLKFRVICKKPFLAWYIPFLTYDPILAISGLVGACNDACTFKGAVGSQPSSPWLLEASHGLGAYTIYRIIYSILAGS